jgi:hypothetical protein
LVIAQTEKAAEIYADILIASPQSNRDALLRDTKLELDLHLKRMQDTNAGMAAKSSAKLCMTSMAFARKYHFSG